MKTNQRLWIFGDSFANTRHGELSWQNLLKNKFVGKDVICSGRGGRDIQTIIDIFLQSLHLISDNDFVIIMLPSAARVRYPVSNARCMLDMGNELKISELKESLMDGFTAYHAHNPYHKNIKNELIFPFNEIDDKFIEDLDEHEDGREIIYGNMELKRLLNKKSKFSYNQSSIFINTSNTMLSNWNKQLYSFSKTFKFGTAFFSWSTDFQIFDNTPVICRDELTRELGYLETDHEMFLETNGEFGKINDFHWSHRTDAKFSEYIIKNNSKYFN